MTRSCPFVIRGIPWARAERVSKCTASMHLQYTAVIICARLYDLLPHEAKIAPAQSPRDIKKDTMSDSEV